MRKGPVPQQVWVRLREFHDQMTKLQRHLADAEYEAIDKDRRVAVVIDHTGNLKNLAISDAAMEEVTGDELCDLILDTYDKAKESMQKEVHAATKKIYGKSFTFDEIAKADVKVDDIAAEARRQHFGP